jgi:hypothetical protein
MAENKQIEGFVAELKKTFTKEELEQIQRELEEDDEADFDYNEGFTRKR